MKFGSSDEAFVSKESSQEELGVDTLEKRLRDSDEYDVYLYNLSKHSFNE